MARHRQPTSILEAKGAFKHNKKRSRPLEPDTGRGVGPAPSKMPVVARKIWDETVENCAPGVFQSSDRFVLEGYCRTMQLFRYNRNVDLHVIDRLMKFWIQFGMTPSARSQIIVKNQQAVEDAEGEVKQGLRKFL